MDNTTKSISAVNGLIQFLNATKPYHTHILDVELNYSYKEEITVRIAETTKTIDIELTESDTPLVYDCEQGYGLLWEDNDDPETHPSTTIVSASAPEYITVDIVDFVGSPQTATKINILNNITPNYLLVGSKVTFVTTGEFPITTPQIFKGVEYEIVESSVFNTPGDYIIVSDGVNTIVWSDVPYSGQLAIEPCDDNINSFVIDHVTGTVFDVSVSSIINSCVVFDIDKPHWRNGTQVEVSSTGVLPAPLDANQLYYIQHVEDTNMIRLSYIRYPIFEYQYVDFTDMGSGTFQIQRTETFFVGQTIEVAGTYNQYNDGKYNVLKTEKISPTQERIFVLGRIMFKTPEVETSDGTVSAYVSGYSETQYCPPTQMSNMHVEAVMYDRVVFELDNAWIMYIGGEFA